MRVNTVTLAPKKYTHEGAIAARTTAEQQLRRAVMACMLWEDTFYESGEDIAKRIASLVKQVSPEFVAGLAYEARTSFKLRHVPLLLLVEMAKLKTHSYLVSTLAELVIQRPDELTEVLAIYAKQNNRTGTKKLNKLSKQLQKGIAAAFRKFDEYSLAKYNQDRDIKLRDALFLSHAKPIGGKTGPQAKLWKRLVNGELKTPDTWEVSLSAATDKKAEWTRLLTEEKLGALALLRNLRNMKEAKVDEKLIRKAILNMNTERVLPFRFVSAARFAPQLEGELEQAMFKSLAEFEKLPGKTVIVVDNSGSMYSSVSGKSDLSRADAAAALAMLVREVCESATVVVFSDSAKTIPSRRGFALREAIQNATSHGSTNTQYALNLALAEGYDRIIVITDEQSHQTISGPKTGTNAYFINVASYQNGIGYGKWTHIDGWSEAVLQYITQAEQ